ncbi:MAG TPA: sigma factor, partial [Longimicrobiales bacterium]
MRSTDPRLASWIREYTPGLLGVARAFAAGEDEAEDLLQEVWITAWRKADERPAGMPLGAWLHRVALNVGRTRRRRRLRRERLRAYWRPGAPA